MMGCMSAAGAAGSSGGAASLSGALSGARPCRVSSISACAAALSASSAASNSAAATARRFSARARGPKPATCMALSTSSSVSVSKMLKSVGHSVVTRFVVPSAWWNIFHMRRSSDCSREANDARSLFNRSKRSRRAMPLSAAPPSALASSIATRRMACCIESMTLRYVSALP
ncbi:MAG: hypothetical protein CAPSK01_004560 [Candidatus Accumulibacter vicinus]|uniref:Uncharacterized protein n=1 Tax=Candidatus Accumulibacter vicinus TaxID=2954382 RepID=A0A084XUP7_9PROT|nr:MAG: hypothetical protein CAPSK01_004560 [Candidatus Accumulibacter vicinus]